MIAFTTKIALNIGTVQMHLISGIYSGDLFVR